MSNIFFQLENLSLFYLEKSFKFQSWILKKIVISQFLWVILYFEHNKFLFKCQTYLSSWKT